MTPDWQVNAAESEADERRVAAFFGEIEGAAEQAYCERRPFHPRSRPGFTRFIELDGRIVSAALLRHDRLHLDGASLDCGFVENILTHPDYRRRGLFRTLLWNTLQYFLDEGLPVAALHGPVKLYAPFGFVAVRHHAQVLLPVAAALELPAPPRVRPFENGDLADVAALYAANYANLAASQERTIGTWKWSIPAWAPHMLVVEDAAARVAGYALIAQHLAGPKLRVVEAAAADTKAALGLLHALAQRAAAADPSLPVIYLPLMPAHPVARAALLAGAQAHMVGPLERGSRGGHEDQATVLDLAHVLRALSPALLARLRASRYTGWRGTLLIDSEDEIARLHIDPARLEVDHGRGFAVATARIPAHLLAPLVLGTYSARDLTAWPGVEIDDTVMGLLDTLFPVRWPASENEDWWIVE